ncbi:response regulator transcription factor [Cryptosporangium phraense]|uniref:Response regulator transcription factor n=1 Tax=Cryptosporangium phraense TaxID=2593070 RepID=A0A545AXK1_9ACTN|nr:response regulator transcription factor [Cryptosporangium phraense]TQS45325.1 response regulator transcription factor [Cryptosporangium phraense]
MTPARVLLIDDHRVFAESLALSLETHADLRCVRLAHTVADGLRAAEATAFDVALLDLRLPGADGFAAIDGLLSRRPDAKIVVLTAHPRPGLAHRALAAGASGFLSKSAGLTEIVEAIHAAIDGRQILGAGLESSPAGIRFTPREHEVLRALSRGLDANRIASTLGISLYTARDHIRAVMSKLDVRTQLDAVITADRLGLITLGTGF